MVVSSKVYIFKIYFNNYAKSELRFFRMPIVKFAFTVFSCLLKVDVVWNSFKFVINCKFSLFYVNLNFLDIFFFW